MNDDKELREEQQWEARQEARREAYEASLGRKRYTVTITLECETLESNGEAEVHDIIYDYMCSLCQQGAIEETGKIKVDVVEATPLR